MRTFSLMSLLCLASACLICRCCLAAEPDSSLDALLAKWKEAWREYRMPVTGTVSATKKKDKADISINLRQPQDSFVVGQPMPLTVVFKNKVKRDLRITGFSPESSCPERGFNWIHTDFLRGHTTVERAETRTTEVVGHTVIRQITGRRSHRHQADPPQEPVIHTQGPCF